MDKIAAYVDDAEHAWHLLAPMLAPGAPGLQWTLVVCPSKLPRRTVRWLTPAQRRAWQNQRALLVQQALMPLFEGCPGSSCEWVLATGSLPVFNQRLHQRLGTDLRALDARRPRPGAVRSPLGTEGPALRSRPWAAPIAISSGLSLVLALTD
jgi:hypothetical protein